MFWLRKHIATRVGRVGTGAAAIIATAVFLWPSAPWSFQADRFAGLLVALGLWLWAEFDGAGEPHPRDLELYKSLFATVSHDERLALAEHNMGDAYHKDRFKGVGRIYDTWRGPGYEFVDTTLQRHWASLKEKLDAYVGALTAHTGPLPGNPVLFTVKTGQDLQTDTRSPLTLQNTVTLNDLARQAAVGLDDFERLARNRLQA